jgi:hypothetical protein
MGVQLGITPPGSCLRMIGSGMRRRCFMVMCPPSLAEDSPYPWANFGGQGQYSLHPIWSLCRQHEA